MRTVAFEAAVCVGEGRRLSDPYRGRNGRVADQRAVVKEAAARTVHTGGGQFLEKPSAADAARRRSDPSTRLSGQQHDPPAAPPDTAHHAAPAMSGVVVLVQGVGRGDPRSFTRGVTEPRLLYCGLPGRMRAPIEGATMFSALRNAVLAATAGLCLTAAASAEPTTFTDILGSTIPTGSFS